MTIIKYLPTATALGLILVLVGCSNSNERIPNNPPNQIYTAVQQAFQLGNWKKAIAQLEALDLRYPFWTASQQVQLDLIYAYYKNTDFSLALTTIERFIHLNPTNPNMDYVIYMRGLTNMALDGNSMLKFFGINRFDKNPQHAYDAYNDFSKLIRNYPHSQYATNATKYLETLKDRLAKYEYSVAFYYTQRGAWIAVVNRIAGILHNYPDTQPARDGLKLMENAYRQMEMNAQADKVSKIIASISNT